MTHITWSSFTGLCEECGERFSQSVPTPVLRRYGGKLRYCSQRCNKTAWARRRNKRPIETGELKACRLCGRWKPRTKEHWHRNVNTADGFSQPCGACQNRRERLRRAKLIERALQLDPACPCGTSLEPRTDMLTGVPYDWCPKCRAARAVPVRYPKVRAA